MDPLVSIDWLADHLHDPDLIVLDATLPPVGVMPVVDVAARYRERHLPGAVFFDIEALSDHNTTLPHMLPAPEIFAESMSVLGVGDAVTIVVYEQVGVFSAPRAWWMLRTMGARKVFMMDGDLHAWIEAGKPTDSGMTSRHRASFRPKFNAAAVRDFTEVEQILASKGQVLDARSAGRFKGTAPEPRPGISSGHMPGAFNVPFTDLVHNGHLRSAEELRALFTADRVDLERPITTSCGSGVTAAVLALGLERCGAAQVSLYDGSWAEYAQRPEAVIVRDDA